MRRLQLLGPVNTNKGIHFSHLANSYTDLNIMNSEDEKLLGKLFPLSTDEADHFSQHGPEEFDFPLAEPSEALFQRLQAIPTNQSAKPETHNVVWNIVWLRKFKHSAFATAAAIIFAIVGTLFVNHQKQMEEQRIAFQAQEDLYTAFLYIEKANRIANDKVTGSLSEGLIKSTVEPVLETTFSTPYPG